jgi:uncharacterized protein YndB with AHSA1/START domain
MQSTRVSRLIAAPPDIVYQAFLDPEALAAWLPPGGMTGRVERLEPRVGGRFAMTLSYPEAQQGQGKTTAGSDRFTGHIDALEPNRKVVWAIAFDSADPGLAGEMRVVTTLEPTEGGTDVTMTAENIPPGISPADNAEGTRLSLLQLARYLAERWQD